MISHRYLSGLRIGHELLYRVGGSTKDSKGGSWDALHLRQAAIDRACGLSCVLMLVMLVEGVPRDHAVSVAWSVRPRLKKIWSVAKAGYFRGTSPASLVRHLEAACEDRQVSQLRGSHSELFALVAEEVARDNVVLLLIGASAKAQLHWVMLVGVESVARARPTKGRSRKGPEAAALLGLDPESPAPICSAFNWRLPRRNGRDRPRATTLTTGGNEEYRELQGAVVLHRAHD